jgi:hypothetical protein
MTVELGGSQLTTVDTQLTTVDTEDAEVQC